MAFACVCAVLALWSGDARAKEPRKTAISYYYDALEQSFLRPIERFFDPALLIRRIGQNYREAENVDENDQVRQPSTWWRPRAGFVAITPEQMLKGPGPGTGPAPGKWRVVRAKTQGVSKGFQIKDSQGVRFAVKFDPPDYAELATGADVVSTYLYWAAGYNVPDNTIATFRREDLEIAPDAKFTDLLGRSRTLTPQFIDDLLLHVPKMPDGSYRVVASRFLTGKDLGEWEYRGRRKDDPEDAIPHELRREIRGLWTINAWINHTDCSARNTKDMWVTEGGRSFVRHYLLDFSGCLGSASIAKQSPRTGFEYFVDFGTAAGNLATLGLRPLRWEDGVDPQIPAAGYIESTLFDPSDWRPFLPNPAFDEASDRDIRWGARIVAGFTDELIRTAVEQGRYSDPRAVEYLTRIMIERRDKLVHHWLGDGAAAATRTAR
jgi:hypothetical protein